MWCFLKSWMYKCVCVCVRQNNFTVHQQINHCGKLQFNPDIFHALTNIILMKPASGFFSKDYFCCVITYKLFVKTQRKRTSYWNSRNTDGSIISKKLIFTCQQAQWWWQCKNVLISTNPFTGTLLGTPVRLLANANI